MDNILKDDKAGTVYGAHGHTVEGADMMLAMELSSLLNEHYPGHKWLVHVNSEGGVVDIRCGSIPMNYGYRLKLARVYADIKRKCVIMGGGEMLERAHLPVGRYVAPVDKLIEGVKFGYQPVIIEQFKRAQDKYGNS